MSVKEEILKEKSNEPFPFYGFSIAVLSLCYGGFLLIFGDYMDGLFTTLFEVIPDWPIAVFLIGSAVIKLLGIHKQHKKLKRIGIVLLSAVWTAIAAVYAVYSFTVGYPNPSFLIMAFIVVVCYRVSKKGDFG
ncbi:hypothetical protein ACFXEB_06670 [Aerococcus urinaeequi]|uniref:hypothetical protein n=1 Tax=Aerococcus urinaeequi TaxID=51665 RepID=UPI00366FBCA6